MDDGDIAQILNRLERIESKLDAMSDKYSDLAQRLTAVETQLRTNQASSRMRWYQVAAMGGMISGVAALISVIVMILR